MVGAGDPAVADEQACEVPEGGGGAGDELGFGGVAFEERGGDVGDVLACVGFTGDVDLFDSYQYVTLRGTCSAFEWIVLPHHVHTQER